MGEDEKTGAGGKFVLGLDAEEINPREVAITRALVAATARLRGYPLQDLLRVAASLVQFVTDRTMREQVSQQAEEYEGEPMPRGARAAGIIFDAYNAADLPLADWILGPALYLDGWAVKIDDAKETPHDMDPAVREASRRCAVEAERAGREPLIAPGTLAELAERTAAMLAEQLGAPVEVMGAEELDALQEVLHRRQQQDKPTVN